MCMKSILKSSPGQKPKGNNLLLLNEFKTLHNFELEDGTNLSSVLDYYTTTMITSICLNSLHELLEIALTICLIYLFSRCNSDIYKYKIFNIIKFYKFILFY